MTEPRKESVDCCGRCGGTGIEKQDRKKASLWCPLCGEAYGGYMVKKEVWREAGLTPIEFRCIDCLIKSLKRELTPSDFNLELPINSGIRIGIELGRRT